MQVRKINILIHFFVVLILLHPYIIMLRIIYAQAKPLYYCLKIHIEQGNNYCSIPLW